jgi:hypothetical protein
MVLLTRRDVPCGTTGILRRHCADTLCEREWNETNRYLLPHCIVHLNTSDLLSDGRWKKCSKPRKDRRRRQAFEDGSEADIFACIRPTSKHSTPMSLPDIVHYWSAKLKSELTNRSVDSLMTKD